MSDSLAGRKLAIVWQFDQLAAQTVDELAEQLRAAGVDALAFKALDGLHWMGEFDRSPLAIHGPADVAAHVAAFAEQGIAAGAWVNVRGFPWRSQAERHAEAAIAAGGWLGLDLEPYADFLGAYPDGTGIAAYLDTLIDQVSNALGDDWTLAGWPDPRPEHLAETRWDRWRDRLTCVYPQCYWTDFQRPWATVLEEAVQACAHPDVRPILPANAPAAEIAAALAHPACAGGAALWRLPAPAETLQAFGTVPRERSGAPGAPWAEPSQEAALATALAHIADVICEPLARPRCRVTTRLAAVGEIRRYRAQLVGPPPEISA